MVNRTLTSLLRAMIGRNLKTWEDCLLMIEFAYNYNIHTSINYSLFKIVYGLNPLTLFDLTNTIVGN